MLRPDKHNTRSIFENTKIATVRYIKGTTTLFQQGNDVHLVTICSHLVSSLYSLVYFVSIFQDPITFFINGNFKYSDKLFFSQLSIIKARSICPKVFLCFCNFIDGVWRSTRNSIRATLPLAPCKGCRMPLTSTHSGSLSKWVKSVMLSSYFIEM